MLGFKAGIFDREQISASDMFSSKAVKRKVAQAMGEWLSQLKCTSKARAQADNMLRIAAGIDAGSDTNVRLSDIIGCIREHVKSCFGVSLKAVKSTRSSSEKANADARLYGIEIDDKFRVEGISDDGNATKPLIKRHHSSPNDDGERQ